MATDGTAEGQPGAAQNRILVSSSRKPMVYINLCKRFLQEYGEVQLSALGIAMSSMVTVGQILKSRQLAVEKKVSTSLEVLADEARPRQKPKMEVVLVKSPLFDEIVAAEAAAAEASGSGATAAADLASLDVDSSGAGEEEGEEEEREEEETNEG